MRSTEAYSGKAENYARYRWDYPADAVRAIVKTAQVTEASSVADIGAGTGMLTKHLAPLAGRVYAVEPNQAMREQARRMLADYPSCVISGASAEDTGLETASVDLITVAQSIHWFEPEPTAREFARILRPGGWLAVIRNIAAEDALSAATNGLMTPEHGAKQAICDRQRATVPTAFYFGTGTYRRLTFPFSLQIDWETYLGSLLSASFTPEEDDPAYEAFVAAARRVFEQFSTDGQLTQSGETELYIGQPV